MCKNTPQGVRIDQIVCYGTPLGVGVLTLHCVGINQIEFKYISGCKSALQCVRINQIVFKNTVDRV